MFCVSCIGDMLATVTSMRKRKKYGGSLTHRLILTDSRHCATILACLKENRPKLTPACRTVMVSHGQ
jgi:hypothetical protein